MLSSLTYTCLPLGEDFHDTSYASSVNSQFRKRPSLLHFHIFQPTGSSDERPRDTTTRIAKNRMAPSKPHPIAFQPLAGWTPAWLACHKANSPSMKGGKISLKAISAPNPTSR